MQCFVDAHDVDLAGTVVPALEVRAGEAVDVCWPGKYMGKEEEALGAFLTRDSQMVSLTACVAYPHKIFGRRSRFFRQSRLVSLRAACDPQLVSDWDALVNESGCDASDRVSTLPLTPRVLFALLLGMSRSRFVVYATAGLDPLGTKRVEAFVREASGRGWAFLRCLQGRPEDGVRIARW